MRSSLKSQRDVATLVSKVRLYPTDVSNYAFISDVIKVPIFSFTHSGEKDTKEILEYSKKFINEYCDAISDLIHGLDTDYIVRDTLYKGEIETEYLSIIVDVINRTGKYQPQHELALQLSHYNSSFCVHLKAALIKQEDYLIPTVVALLNFEANNKFDNKLNKALELDIVKLV
jgi:hypothetical protein